MAEMYEIKQVLTQRDDVHVYDRSEHSPSITSTHKHRRQQTPCLVRFLKLFLMATIGTVLALSGFYTLFAQVKILNMTKII